MREALSEPDRVKWDEEHARTHVGQEYGAYPVLPFHAACTDVLHLLLNIFKVGASQLFHVPLQRKFKGAGMKEFMAALKDKADHRMAEEFTRLRFGGEGVWACTGPQLKTFLRGGKRGTLLIDLIGIFMPYFALLESDGALPTQPGEEEEEEDPEVAAATSNVPAKNSNTKGKKRAAPAKAKAKPPAKKPAKQREVTLAEDDEVEDEAPDPAPARAASPGSSPARAAATQPDPVTALTFREKGITMLLSMSALYSYLHQDAGVDARDITQDMRKARAHQASKLGGDVAVASLAVCGTAIRQTYLHDAVYGMATLYLYLGKPYLGATEGNEHAHQRMKKMFREMCSHSNKRIGDALQLMNLQHMFRHVVEEQGAFAPPTAESSARMGLEWDGQAGTRTRKDTDAAIAVQDALLRAQAGGSLGERGGCDPHAQENH